MKVPVFAAMILTSYQLLAAEPKPMVMPWQLHGFNPEFYSLQKQDFETARSKLAAALMETPVSLGKRPSRRAANSTLAVKDVLVPVEVSTEASPAQKKNAGDQSFQSYQPILCNTLGRIVLFLDVSALPQGIYQSLGYRTIAADAYAQAVKEQRAAALLSTSLQQLLEESRTLPPAQQPSPVKLAFVTTKDPSRKDSGPSVCLSLLQASHWSQKVRLQKLTGLEHLRQVAYYMELNPPIRANRTLRLEWHLEELPQGPVKPETPLPELPLTVRALESVHGRHTQDLGQERLLATEPPFAIQPSKAIGSQIERWATELRPTDAPVIADTYGAWVYVDRGRAWGLMIGDRLVVEGRESDIKGHVVGYFGPRWKMRSPRGFLIEEGAIVYIRKGQKLVAKGQSFVYDSKRFPTPWPPRDLPIGTQ